MKTTLQDTIRKLTASAVEPAIIIDAGSSFQRKGSNRPLKNSATKTVSPVDNRRRRDVLSNLSLRAAPLTIRQPPFAMFSQRTNDRVEGHIYVTGPPSLTEILKEEPKKEGVLGIQTPDKIEMLRSRYQLREYCVLPILLPYLNFSDSVPQLSHKTSHLAERTFKRSLIFLPRPECKQFIE